MVILGKQRMLSFKSYILFFNNNFGLSPSNQVHKQYPAAAISAGTYLAFCQFVGACQLVRGLNWSYKALERNRSCCLFITWQARSSRSANIFVFLIALKRRKKGLPAPKLENHQRKLYNPVEAKSSGNTIVQQGSVTY